MANSPPPPHRMSQHHQPPQPVQRSIKRQQFPAVPGLPPFSCSSGPLFDSFPQENVAAYSSVFLPPADPCSCVSLFACFRTTTRKARYLYAPLHYTTTLHLTVFLRMLSIGTSARQPPGLRFLHR